MKHTTSFIWFIPFISFFIGYSALRFLDNTTTLKTPKLLGISTNQALDICSKHNLQLRVIQSQIDSYIPEDTILSQKPKPGSHIKKQQTIFITTSKQPDPTITPQIVGRMQESIPALCSEKNIRYKIRTIPSSHPHGTCIAQTPDPHTKLTDNKLIIYCSDSCPQKHYVLPSFIGYSYHEVTAYLEQQHIPYTLHVEPKKFYQKQNDIITKQKPLPGSLITLQEPFCLHLSA